MERLTAYPTTLLANQDIPEEVELLQTGEEWESPLGEEFTLTRDRFEQAINHFNEGVVHPDNTLPINEDHRRPGPALGWIKNLSIRDNEDGGFSLWATKVEWTDRGKELLKSKEYRYISAEFAFIWIDPNDENHVRDNVLEGAALTNYPLFNKLEPLVAHRKGLTANHKHEKLDSDSTSTSQSRDSRYYRSDSNDRRNTVQLQDILQKDLSDLTDEEVEHLKANKDQLTDEQVEQFGLKAEDNNNENENENGQPEPGQTVEPSNVEANQGQSVTIEASKLNALQRQAEEGSQALAKLSRMEASQKTETLLASKGGWFPMDQHDNLTEFYMSLDGTQAGQFNKLMEALPENTFTKEQGGDHADNRNPYELLREKATEKMEANKEMSFKEAITKARKENPDLANEYDQQRSE